MSSLPPQVKAMMAIPDLKSRMAQAINLANQGFSIDLEIMVYLDDPYLVNQMRAQDGYTWVPSILQPNVEVAPGLPAIAGLKPYDPNNPPPRSIPVFWPSPPASLLPPPDTILAPQFSLGPLINDQEFPGAHEMFGDGAKIPINKVVTLDNVNWIKVILAQSPFAPNGYVTGWVIQSD